MVIGQSWKLLSRATRPSLLHVLISWYEKVEIFPIFIIYQEKVKKVHFWWLKHVWDYIVDISEMKHLSMWTLKACIQSHVPFFGSHSLIYTYPANLGAKNYHLRVKIEAHLQALLVNYTFGFTRDWSTSRLSPEPWIDFSQKIYRCCRKVNFLNAICDFNLIWPAFSKKCKKIWWRDCHSQK